ncbi:DUF1569 domain-containing protein [Flavihumibacter petaseus]|uniref:DinB-like domain-containing protein n=1 Tax=Flavihumibacter petaseus NBRC 106054 TaxID=1220578 RepID=A0A0E9MZ36_9BACT|nr:DUF1569 domain-containing protein [Flavihumibacter petaseus]GAO42997.1 hypothetical protein FPE01S_02_01020 [Flavihumibacter petaseus NBRC 106054]
MKSIHDAGVRGDLIARISALTGDSQRQWGKMNVYEMLKHNLAWEDMMWGRKVYKQVLIGKVFGKRALRSVLKDESPLSRNSPTVGDLKVKLATGDLEALKQEWIKGIAAYAQYNNPTFVHPFFGAMSHEQIGYFVYKHADHHLRQFGQ